MKANISRLLIVMETGEGSGEEGEEEEEDIPGLVTTLILLNMKVANKINITKNGKIKTDNTVQLIYLIQNAVIKIM
jgi:hypothetical protein